MNEPAKRTVLDVLRNAKAQIALLGGWYDEVNLAHIKEIDMAIKLIEDSPIS